MATVKTIPTLASMVTVKTILSLKGKVTKNAERAYDALNGQSKAVVLSVALHGTNATMRKTASTGFTEAQTLEQFIVDCDKTNTGVWRDLYTLLAARVGTLVQGSMGRQSVIAMLDIARSNMQNKIRTAYIDNPSKVQALEKALASFNTDIADPIKAIAALQDAAKEAAIAAKQAKKETVAA